MALKDQPRARKKPPVHGAPCSIGEAYRTNMADAEELEVIHEILYADDNNHMEVVAEFARGGYTVSRTAAANHRAKRCRCFNIDKDFCPDCRRHLDFHGECA